jgi:hypothetical protein
MLATDTVIHKQFYAPNVAYVNEPLDSSHLSIIQGAKVSGFLTSVAVDSAKQLCILCQCKKWI